MSFILRHRGAQLILAYSWARPAILVAAKGRGGCFYFFCFFTFIPVPLSSLSLSFIPSTISSIFFLPFSGRRHKMTHKGWRVVKPQLNQSIKKRPLYYLIIRASTNGWQKFWRSVISLQQKQRQITVTVEGIWVIVQYQRKVLMPSDICTLLLHIINDSLSIGT